MQVCHVSKEVPKMSGLLDDTCQALSLPTKQPRQGTNFADALKTWSGGKLLRWSLIRTNAGSS